VTAEAELNLDLKVQPGLVPLLLRRRLRLHCHEDVGALLRDELKKRFGRVQGVRLDQYAACIHGRKEYQQGLALVGIACIARSCRLRPVG
jgi:hypothetical protein